MIDGVCERAKSKSHLAPGHFPIAAEAWKEDGLTLRKPEWHILSIESSSRN